MIDKEQFDVIAKITPDDIARLPSLPGVYLFYDSKDEVIYVGKAINLYNRVHSYFTKRGDPRVNARLLVKQIVRVETIITGTEKEAFILENTLIKKHRPRYNIRLRDDKTYLSLKINMDHPWPRVTMVRRRTTRNDATEVVAVSQKANSHAKPVYLGPFISSLDIRKLLHQLQRVFPLRTCSDHVLKQRKRPCLFYQVGRCCAPCQENTVDQAEYRHLIDGFIMFFKGKTEELIVPLREQMAKHSEAMEYEQAAKVRDRIQAIDTLRERQNVHRHSGTDQDFIALARAGGFGAFVVFQYRNGVLIGSRPFLVHDYDQPSAEMMSQFLTSYYELEQPPSEVFVTPFSDYEDSVKAWLSEKRGNKVLLNEPQRGDKADILKVTLENANKLLEQHLSGQSAIQRALLEISEKFGLTDPPEIMECFDISTLQGSATVGSMVVFKNGEPDKSRWRRFKIRSFEGQDDFAAMREILSRRYRNLSPSDWPSLIVIDGGRGQLSAALAVLNELGLSNVPIVGMAKARQARVISKKTKQATEERFFLPGRENPVLFKPSSPALYMLIRLRDETHRFGITYHRGVRKSTMMTSSIETIPGVGKARAKAILRKFGSLKKLRSATVDEIATMVPKGIAERIYDHLNSENSPNSGNEYSDTIDEMNLLDDEIEVNVTEED